VRYGELEVPTPEEMDAHLAHKAIQIRRPSNEEALEFAKMFNNPFLSDITFVVGSQMFHGHKAILASRSDYFASLFRAGMKDSTASQLPVHDFSAAAFQEVLRCVYTGRCSAPHLDGAVELLSAAEYYSLPQLKKWAEFYMSQFVDVETVSIIYEAAKAYDAPKLKKIAFEFIIANYGTVSQADTFDKMNKDSYKEILLEVVSRLPAEAKLSSSPPKS